MAYGFAKVLLPCAAALSLAACSGQDDADKTYVTDVEDRSGGELIVSTPDPDSVPVTLPETPMTPAPDESATPPAAATSPVATPTPGPTPAG